jgi:caffeoyl-CoA O-methyltransferase
MKTYIKLATVFTAWAFLALSARAQSSPGNSGPGGPAPGRGGGRGPAATRTGTPPLQSVPLAKDEAEKKVLDALDYIIQTYGRGISVPRDDGRFLRLLAESSGAKNVVELGTFHGYSGLWICLALRGTGGHLTTFEIDRQNAEISRRNFQRAGVDALVTLVEGDAHQEVGKLKGPVDLVFIDADKEGYVDYLNKLWPVLRPGGLVVAHNITPGMADPAFIKAITTNAAMETIFMNTGNPGISVSMKKR